MTVTVTVTVTVYDGTRKQSSSTKRVKNFGTDLRDGEALSFLLNQLDPTVCDISTEPLRSEARARHIIRNAKVRSGWFEIWCSRAVPKTQTRRSI